MLDRSAVAVRPKQLFLDWLNSIDTDTRRNLADLPLS